MRKKSQYTLLLRFAFLPPSVMEYARKKLNFDDLEAYLQFSFEKNMKCGQVMEKEQNAYFNTGLQNKMGDLIYAYFIPNENKRQKWVLRLLAPAAELHITDQFAPPICTLHDYQRDFFDFAYAHSDKYQPLVPLIGSLPDAREHIRKVFRGANQLGYILYENGQAIFHTGVKSADHSDYYAVFSKNKNDNPEWYLNGFFTKPLGFSALPDYVFESGQGNSLSDQPTLLVAADSADFHALKTVLQAEHLSYEEREDSSVGGRPFRYLSVPKLNATALLTGHSYHCFIPVVQAILLLHPSRAIFFGTSCETEKQSSIIVSKAVRSSDNPDNPKNDLEANPILCRLLSQSGTSPHRIVSEVLTGNQDSFYFAHICKEFGVPWAIVKIICGDDMTPENAAVSAWEVTVSGLQKQAVN